MKKVTFILSLSVLFLANSCGGGSRDNAKSASEKSGIYEPQTKEEFVKILTAMNITPYPNAVITGFEHHADAMLTYKVAAKGNTNKAIINYYRAELEKAFNGKPDWKRHMNTAASISYMKGYDLSFNVVIASKDLAMELAGSTDAKYIPDSLSYEVSLGDGAISY